MSVAVIVPMEWSIFAVVLTATVASAWAYQRWLYRAAPLRQEQLQNDLHKARLQIRDFAASQSRFISTLAEEIQAPLETARGHAELLLASAGEPATVERFARILNDDVRHLSALVDSFLRLARPSAHEDTSKHVPVHVHDVLMAAVGRCTSLASTHDVTLVPNLAETLGGAPVEVLGDAILLEAMLENLVRNGILSSPRGARVELQVRVVGDEVRVVVHDGGTPIAIDVIEDVLHGFFPVPEPARPPFASRLSLAIAMRVAEHHRGTISLSNGGTGGCTFEVHLPRWSGDRGPTAGS